MDLSQKVRRYHAAIFHHDRIGADVVEKDELMNSCWPDSFVEEANIAENVCMIRRALGDARHTPEYIETVHRRGYRFIASVSVRVQAPETVPQRAQEWKTGAPQLLSSI